MVGNEANESLSDATLEKGRSTSLPEWRTGHSSRSSFYEHAVPLRNYQKSEGISQVKTRQYSSEKEINWTARLYNVLLSL